MEKVRAVIKYLCKKGMSPKEIHEGIMETLGKESPYSTVKKCASEFRKERVSIEDDEWSGHPKEATTDENVEIVHSLVTCDRRQNLRDIASEVGISFGAAQSILTNILKMSKVSARRVPRMLTEDQKRSGLKFYRHLLSCCEDDPEEFMDRVVTQDETWIHHFDPEAKKQSVQWKHPGSPPPKKLKRVSSAGKVMTSVFWDNQGIIMIDYLEEGCMINGAYYSIMIDYLEEGCKITGAYYSEELRQLCQEIVRKRRGKLTRGFLHLQANAPAHVLQVAMAAANECGLQVLPYLSYTPDLAPVDFSLKTNLRGRNFGSNEGVIDAVNEYLGDQDEDFYSEGISKLEQR